MSEALYLSKKKLVFLCLVIMGFHNYPKYNEEQRFYCVLFLYLKSSNGHQPKRKMWKNCTVLTFARF